MVGIQQLLFLDAEYRKGVEEGRFKLIAPKRNNPTGAKWLPVWETPEATVLFSNTGTAHQLSRTRDWVVIYYGNEQYTVVTETKGPWKGQRVVRGRESECAKYRTHSREAV